MKEINDILKSYREALSNGKKTALATVVKVEGSSYRQPGARMLVTEDGMLTGAISGGCLEGDALRRALLAINQKHNKLITYDTSDESVQEFSVQLGCNGIVYILFEYIDDSDLNNPIKLLEKSAESRDACVIATRFSLNRNADQIGTFLLYRGIDDGDSENEDLKFSLQDVLQNRTSALNDFIFEDTKQSVLLQYIPSPVSLLVVGAGNDAKPVVTIADLLGWEVTVGEGRITHATTKRFPEAKKVIVAKAEELLNDFIVDDRTFVLLMTHNYHYDLQVLKLLLQTDCSYIGTLGPRTKLLRMISDLNDEGIIVTDQDMKRIYGPIGLDIGAETSEEIALSAISEIKAVMESRKGTSLRYRTDKIHGQKMSQNLKND